MEWYKNYYFYRLKLLNDSYEYWVTTLNFKEAKDTIGSQPFILVNERGEKKEQWELNTKVIKSIEDVTESERKSIKEENEDKVKRLTIIKKIRKIKLSRFYKWKYGLSIPPVENPDWFDKGIGMDIDYLMKWNEDYLKELLNKCKEKSKTTVKL